MSVCLSVGWLVCLFVCLFFCLCYFRFATSVAFARFQVVAVGVDATQTQPFQSGLQVALLFALAWLQICRLAVGLPPLVGAPESLGKDLACCWGTLRMSHTLVTHGSQTDRFIVRSQTGVFFFFFFFFFFSVSSWLSPAICTYSTEAASHTKHSHIFVGYFAELRIRINLFTHTRTHMLEGLPSPLAAACIGSRMLTELRA